MSVLRWEPLGAHVRVTSDGTVVAESDDAKLLHEQGHRPVVYVPDDDVQRGVLEPSDHHTHCPRKGDASYWSLPGKPNAVWYYPDPIEGAEFIRGHVAFYGHLVDIEVGA